MTIGTLPVQPGRTQPRLDPFRGIKAQPGTIGTGPPQPKYLLQFGTRHYGQGHRPRLAWTDAGVFDTRAEAEAAGEASGERYWRIKAIYSAPDAAVRPRSSSPAPTRSFAFNSTRTTSPTGRMSVRSGDGETSDPTRKLGASGRMTIAMQPLRPGRPSQPRLDPFGGIKVRPGTIGGGPPQPKYLVEIGFPKKDSRGVSYTGWQEYRVLDTRAEAVALGEEKTGDGPLIYRIRVIYPAPARSAGALR